jgi:hypothetical protein
MKNLKFIIVSVMMLLLSQVVLSQVERLYALDKQGNVIADITNMDTVLDLSFEDDVPELTEQQVSELIKHGKIEKSSEKVKGHYEKFLLFYVPVVEVDSCFLEGSVVTYKSFVTKGGDRVFTWWFAFALLSIFFMVITQIAINNDRNLFVAVVAFAFTVVAVAMFAVVAFPAAAFSQASVVAFAFAFTSCAFAFAVVFVDKNNKILTNIFVYMYYVCMFATCIFAYLQI